MNVEDITKAIRSAKSRSEIKNALQVCLACTTSLASDPSRYRSGNWFLIGDALLHALNPSFVGVLSKREHEDLLVGIFVQAPAIDSIPLLVHALKKGAGDDNARTGYLLEKSLEILDAVIKKNLPKLFIELSTPATIERDNIESTARLIQDLSSIPDRAASVVRGGCVDRTSVLSVDFYCKTVAVAIIQALKHCHDRLSTGTGDCSLKFLSDLLGKLYVTGYGRQVIPVLASSLYGHCCGLRDASTDDFVWRRLSKRLFTGVPTLALDGMVADVVVVLSSRDPGKIVDLEKLLGDSVEKEEKIKYVLTNKLLLTRHFDRAVLVPETIFRYLANTEERRKKILHPTLIKLFTVWSSPTSVTRNSFDKHFFISRSMIIGCLGLAEQERNEIRDQVTPLLLRGISSHLNAVDENVRKIGMVTGELLTNLFTLGKSNDQLKFEYEEDENTKYLKQLVEGQSDQEFVSIPDFIQPKDSYPENEASTEFKGGPAKYKVATGLDSDDDEDLVPYDLPRETDEEAKASSTEKLPVYIRDCLDCIVERKSFHLYETALKLLEQLIRRNSPGADDLSLEVVQVLLHAEDHYGLEKEFSTRQRSIMTACCARQPKRVATYLAGEFYEKNYSIQHRLLMLDVFVNAAKELSKPITQKMDVDEELVAPKKEEPMAPTPLVPTWRQVVQARIETRTRRWGSAVTGQIRNQQPAAPNRFSPVAGSCFFYPLLLEMDKPVDTLDMFGADYIVLGRLLFVTGTILFEAENAPGLTSMAIAQIQRVLRRTGQHEQPFVRQGSLFSLIMALLAIPSRILASEYQDELMEVQIWLEEVQSNDPDEQCRQLASQALLLVAKKANEGLNAMIEVGLPK